MPSLLSYFCCRYNSLFPLFDNLFVSRSVHRVVSGRHMASPINNYKEAQVQGCDSFSAK